ncbi:MAG: molecular chaperone HtpG, partial [Chitinivibrionales bacterium]|nr:molecular chaperone HtpG [Chitinivibrionales bacterium]MBD3356055.1 molecular chaperone HtpG [Chitinivibrionales bacterium]
PLNVSRETLQHNPLIHKIRKALVSRVLGKFSDLAESDPAKYREFWDEFGPIIKEGLHMDYENRDKLLELARFRSSMGTSADDLVSLKQYVGRMREGQKDIYYIHGENLDIVEKSPHLEVFKEKGIEVLYLVDPIDEFIVPNNVYDYDGKKLVSVTQGDLDLGELGKEEEKKKKKADAKYKKLLERIKNILANDVKEVRVTTRLKDSPCCLVSDGQAVGAYMEKLMKSMGQEVPESKPTLEVNVEHPVVANLETLYERDPKNPQLDEWVNILYDQALIAAGQGVRDPLTYSKRINELLTSVSASSAEAEGTQDG